MMKEETSWEFPIIKQAQSSMASILSSLVLPSIARNLELISQSEAENQTSMLRAVLGHLRLMKIRYLHWVEAKTHRWLVCTNLQCPILHNQLRACNCQKCFKLLEPANSLSHLHLPLRIPSLRKFTSKSLLNFSELIKVKPSRTKKSLHT